jgi:tetratricopeptide (TPR) repeat protein
MRANKFLFGAALSAAFLFTAISAVRAESEADKVARSGSEAAKAKDLNKAVDDFRRASQMDRKYAPNYFAALLQRGATYRQSQKFQEAIADFTEALKVNPNDETTYERRADAYLQLKDYQKALADYDKCIQMDPKAMRVYLLRSYIYEVLGKLKEGIADCDTVLQLQPGNPEAQARKDRLNKRLNAPATPAPTPAGPIANPYIKASPSPAASAATAASAAPAKP